MKFSANLGFLWNERPLPDAIHAAKAAGFDAVECHWPYDVPATEVRAALDATGLRMLGLNTSRGDVAAGQNGLSALPDNVEQARAAIDEAIEYANAIDAAAIHVMAGFADGPSAHDTFVSNLKYACKSAPDKTILIEPLNRHDAPGYFLANTDQAIAIISQVDCPNLKLMFDCYHVGRTEGDVTTRLSKLSDHVGHIQFAAVPGRGAPDHGELTYEFIFAHIKAMEWEDPLGAEYKSELPTDETLGWLEKSRRF